VVTPAVVPPRSAPPVAASPGPATTPAAASARSDDGGVRPWVLALAAFIVVGSVLLSVLALL